MRIQPQSISELPGLLTDRTHTTNLEQRLARFDDAIRLSPKLSRHLIERLATIDANQHPLRVMAEALSVSRRFTGPVALQADAVQTALKAFGLAGDASAVSVHTVRGRETTLARIHIVEDSVVEHDARQIRGHTLVRSDVTGWAVFERRGERLEVITANKRDLETVFGVDLVYLNQIRGNIVMLQYKMLNPSRARGAANDGGGIDWVYRPDSQLDKELRQMRHFSKPPEGDRSEYRLNPTMFYLKFVKRDGAIHDGSVILPIEHFEQVRAAPASRGPRGGVRISFRDLDGRYLREGPFLHLIHAGYIGAHPKTTDQIKTLVDWILQNGRSAVVAIQQQMSDRDVPGDSAV